MDLAGRIRLVVNADDLGLHPALDDGILQAHREGIVTSTTLLATGASAAEGVRRAQAQGLAVGLHLCLSTRLPAAAADVPSVAPGGLMRGNWAAFARDWLLRRVRADEVQREFNAQLARARALGADVDHLDGHQHLHLLPGVAAIAIDLARRERLPLRWPADPARAEWLRRPSAGAKSALLNGLALLQRPRGVQTVSAVGAFEAGCLDSDRLARVLTRLDAPGDYELGAHPGRVPARVPEDPQWHYGWEAELAALCGPGARAIVQDRGIELTTYRRLFAST